MLTKEKQVYKEAKRYKACELLKCTEDTTELMSLFFSPQGIEFCAKYNVPSLDAFRRFRGLQSVCGGFYIDTPIKAKNHHRMALIGNETIAELEYTETEGFHVVLMHGAKARITASGYAVVFLTNVGCDCDIVIKDRARVLQ
jgi:hypothetical protein